jgi:cathepsin D
VNCAGHKLYDPRNSSTSIDLGKHFSLRYGSGATVNITTYADDVTVSGLTATDQTLGVATTYSAGFAYSNFPPDGLMGLAWAQISVSGTFGYFQTLIAQGQVNNQVFGVKLATSGSELLLGGVNEALYKDPFTWVPVTKEVSYHPSFIH